MDAAELIEKLETWKQIKNSISESQREDIRSIFNELLSKDENIVLLKEKLKNKHSIQRALLRILVKQCVDLLSDNMPRQDDQLLIREQRKVHLMELMEILALREKRDSAVKWEAVSVLLNFNERGALRIFYEILADLGQKELQMVYQKNIYPGVNPDGGLPFLLDLILEGREYDTHWLYKCINWVVESACEQETVHTLTITRLEDYFRQKPTSDARLKSLYTLLAKVVDGNQSPSLKEYAITLWESWSQSGTAEMWVTEFRLLGDALKKPTTVNESGNLLQQSIIEGQYLQPLNNGIKDDSPFQTNTVDRVLEPAKAGNTPTVPSLKGEPVPWHNERPLEGPKMGGHDKNLSHKEGDQRLSSGREQRQVVVKDSSKNINSEDTSSDRSASSAPYSVNSMRSLIGSFKREIDQVEKQLLRVDELTGEVKTLHTKLRDGQMRFDETVRELEGARKRISALEKVNIENDEHIQELYDVNERREKDARLALMEAEYAVANYKQLLWGLLEPNLFEAMNESIDPEDLSINEQILLGNLRQILEVLKDEQVTN